MIILLDGIDQSVDSVDRKFAHAANGVGQKWIFTIASVCFIVLDLTLLADRRYSNIYSSLKTTKPSTDALFPCLIWSASVTRDNRSRGQSDHGTTASPNRKFLSISRTIYLLLFLSLLDSRGGCFCLPCNFTRQVLPPQRQKLV